jgi:anti-anti-sigma factor
MLAPQVVALSGEIDPYTATDVRPLLDAIDGPAVIDLAGVTMLTSSGLTELVRVANRVGYHTVTLTNPSPSIRRVLALVRFEKLFVIA